MGDRWCVELHVDQEEAKPMLAELDQHTVNRLVDKFAQVLRDLDDIGERIWSISHHNKALFKTADQKLDEMKCKIMDLNPGFGNLPGHPLAQWREFKRIIQRAPQLYDLEVFSMSNWLNSYINGNDRLRDIIETVYCRTRADVSYSRLCLLRGLDIETFVALAMFYDNMKAADIFHLDSAMLSSAVRLIPVLLRRQTVDAEWTLTYKMTALVGSLRGGKGINRFKSSLSSSHQPVKPLTQSPDNDVLFV